MDGSLFMRARNSMVVKEDGQFMKKTLCRSAFLEDVATLFGVAQDQDIHGQCTLEVF
jgi:hypothetical protein